MEQGLIKNADHCVRCSWVGHDEQYQRYHDEEWGRPVTDDRRLFEKMSLEGFQAGLSWLTILRKRENFRRAFDAFDYKKVAHYTDAKVEELLQDEGIIRHRGKIEAVINNARCMDALLETYGSLARFFWSFEPAAGSRPADNRYEDISQITQTDESKALSKALKAMGFKFIGPTTMYALMQAMGLVNDHIEGCCVYHDVETLRRNFTRP